MTHDPNASHHNENDHHHHHDESGNGGGGGGESLFLLTSDGVLIAYESGHDKVRWIVELNKHVQEDEDEERYDQDKSWFNVTYVDEIDSLTCLSHSGHIVTVQTSTGEAESVGTFDHGIECGSWSPDLDVLALFTFTTDDDDDEDDMEEHKKQEEKKRSVLMTMNAQFEILSEVTVEDAIPSFSSSDTTTSTAKEEAQISLSWRPDGTSLCISTLDTTDKTRRIRTYDRDDLNLLSVGKSEDGSGKTVPNLLSTSGVAWSSSGGCSNLIAAVQKKGRRKNASKLIVFFEPNGLQHGEFKLRPSTSTATTDDDKVVLEEVVTGLDWNNESDLLSVTFRVICNSKSEEGGEEEKISEYGKVQLWHRNNYHWYLKYELRYEKDTIVNFVSFGEEQSYKLTVSLSSSSSFGKDKHVTQWRVYDFVWDASIVHPNDFNGTAYVIDGNKINATPLGRAMIPPPMSAGSIDDLDAPVVSVCIFPPQWRRRRTKMTTANNTSTIEGLAHLSNGSLVVFGTDGKEEHKSKMIANYECSTVLASIALSKCDIKNAAIVNHEVILQNEFDWWSSLRQFLIVSARDCEDGGKILRLLATSCLSNNKNCLAESLVEISLRIFGGMNNESSGNDVEIKLIGVLPLEGKVLRMVNWLEYNATTTSAFGEGEGALIELDDGSLIEYNCNNSSSTYEAAEEDFDCSGQVMPSSAEPLLEPCPWIYALHYIQDSTMDKEYAHDHRHDHPSEEVSSSNSRSLVVGLSSRSRLYCGERLLSNAASTFILSPAHRFLSYVTLGSRSQLRFIPLNNLAEFDPLLGSDENLVLEGYEPRNVERGSRLVAILTKSPSAVLQLPRGNLEGVFPRALVLPFVMALIDSGEYGQALTIMRRQKVDLNLLVDMNPTHFLEGGGAEQLVSQVRVIDYMNLFLSNLSDLDITLWKYKVPSWLPRGEGTGGGGGGGDDDGNDEKTNKFDFTTKVNRVCAKVREVMTQAELEGVTTTGQIISSGHFLFPILSTFAKESLPKLEEALTMIKNSAFDQFASGDTAGMNTKRSPLLLEKAQNSIQYLAFLANYELLFDTALGMYDFDLAKAVARNSQMDPKVYLPMLKRWRNLPDAGAKYEVDVRLKRYDSALKNLVQLGQDETESSEVAGSDDAHFEKCLSFINEHKLHKLGLELYEHHAHYEHKIMVALGEQLLSEQKGDVALTVFLAANPSDINGAKRAARMCGDWKSYFAYAAEDDRDEGSGHGTKESRIRAVAESIAEEVCFKGEMKGDMQKKRESIAGAARIYLDYCGDVASAVDMLIKAEMWSEGRRVSRLHSREDLVKMCVDAAVSYGQKCLGDFEDRISEFTKANERYGEVLEIRKDAKREEGDTGAFDFHQDDGGSVFSMASNASNTSLQSNMSAGSVGSVTSVSSVISAGAVSTFSITSDVDVNKHKSKFNKLGGKKKKKRPKKKGPAAKRRIQPGSEEELKSLVMTLKSNCIDEAYYDIIAETIEFLAQVGRVSLASQLFDSYNQMRVAINDSQQNRLSKAKAKEEDAKKKALKEGHDHDNTFVKIDCEDEVDALCCKMMPDALEQVFSFF